MEQGPASDVHERPLHPYTTALHAASPVTDPVAQRERRAARGAITRREAPGERVTGHAGCPFAARCAFVENTCLTTRPKDIEVGVRTVACHMYDAASGHTRAGAGLPDLAHAST